MSRPLSWDIFCRVVDNFGDAGVCWRLARQLAHEHGGQVRLFIDDLQVLRALEPAVLLIPRQWIDGVEVREWPRIFSADVAEVAIEAFGCGLPDEYVTAIGRSRDALWIVLEYLSAERWVSEHHGLPSPHPRTSLQRYFFFPGFSARTGGLLRERELLRRRDCFDSDQEARLWERLGWETPAPGSTVISLFAYDTAPLDDLLVTWAEGDVPIVALLPEGTLAREAIARYGANASPLEAIRRDALELRVIPFVPQRQYDELLWACDCNFVRGEDSFVRAQWAARPFVWQIYPQRESAHALKLQAFLDAYASALSAESRLAASNMMHAWNQTGGTTVTLRSAWKAYAAQLTVLRDYGDAWAQKLAATGDLASNLAQFCREKLK